MTEQPVDKKATCRDMRDRVEALATILNTEVHCRIGRLVDFDLPADLSVQLALGDVETAVARLAMMLAAAEHNARIRHYQQLMDTELDALKSVCTALEGL